MPVLCSSCDESFIKVDTGTLSCLGHKAFELNAAKVFLSGFKKIKREGEKMEVSHLWKLWENNTWTNKTKKTMILFVCWDLFNFLNPIKSQEHHSKRLHQLLLFPVVEHCENARGYFFCPFRPQTNRSGLSKYYRLGSLHLLLPKKELLLGLSSYVRYWKKKMRTVWDWTKNDS